MPASIEARLPAYPTPFIGRNDEIAAISERLADPQCRLLTLVGPGGMGKTRLAVEVTKNIAQTEVSVDGIYFIDLQPVNSGEVLVTKIANAIGILFSGSQSPREQLLNALSERESILLMDNFEQLLDSVDLLSDIVRIAPHVKLLVTSREALHIQEEWIWRVRGLTIPAPGIPIESFSAVQLFAERAHRAQQDFTFAGQEPQIARICQLVDGMPLALELAAGWTSALSCAEIAGEIQRSLDFLTTPMRNVPERHRSMQAIFDYSWRLLTDDERAVFPKLSVFRGGFRREAAEYVTGASLVVLAGLVDKSFLRLSVSGRYEIHELMRQYGEEWLDAEVREDTQARHCTYYVGFLHQRKANLRSSDVAETLAEIGNELDNVRLSWVWAVNHDLRQAIHQSMHSLFVYLATTTQSVEGERLFNLAANRFQHEGSATLAYLLLAQHILGWYNGKTIKADLFPRAIQLAYIFWTEDEIALPLRAYLYIRPALIANNLFDDQRAEQVYHDFLEIFRAHDQPWGVTFMIFCLGDISMFAEKFEEAAKYYRQSLDDFIKLGDRWACAWSTGAYAWALTSARLYREALPVWEHHQDLCAEMRNSGGIVFALRGKAGVAYELHENNTARLYIAQAIEAHFASGSELIHLGMTFSLLIDVFLSEDKDEQAAELLSFWRQRAVKAEAQEIVAECDQKLAPLAEQLPLTIYQQAIERGKTLHLRTILERLREELSASSSSISEPSTSSPPAQPLTDPLTERELEVLRLLAAGRSNRDIAHDLVLALGTVKWYISEIYSKLGVASRTQAIARARELNLLS